MDRALLPDMAIHSPEAALWRRIIWNGLLLVLKEEAPAYRGLDIWQKQFGVHARFAALLPFSHQVSAELGVKQMALYEALLSGSLSKPVDLPNDPIDGYAVWLKSPFAGQTKVGRTGLASSESFSIKSKTALENGSGNVSVKVEQSNETVVFQTILDSVLESCGKIGSSTRLALCNDLNSQLEMWHHMPASCRLELRHYVNQRISHLQTEYPVQVRRGVIHAIYIWLCETLGPVMADRVFGQAIQNAEDLPQALKASPRDLL